MSGPNELKGPDLSKGVAASEIQEGKMLLGHAEGEAVLLAKRNGEVFAVGAACSHYGGALVDGLFQGDTVRCPLHHACFSLRTGQALHAPALNPIARYDVEERAGRVVVLGRAEDRPTLPGATPTATTSLVIVGGGAAGQAAAEMLRREGYVGRITILSADESPPCDRPNLSKDYLAGTAPEEWIPLRPPEFFAENHIDLVLGARVTAIEPAEKRVLVGDRAYSYDALLLATGAEPAKLAIPGGDLPHVRSLRTLADSRAIVERLGSAKRAVVIGASFIGLEVAAALRTRKIEVHVVAPEARPLERVLGAEVGDWIRSLHEEHGVVFHLEKVPVSIDARAVHLASGEALDADIVVAGIGVHPSVALAEKAGLALDRGVAVNEYLETSVPGIFAAGDIARWPDPHSHHSIRVEHWVVAERQGQIAARNMLGRKERCTLVPFFWSQHYDVQISYVGHAESWDRVEIAGSLAKRDCRIEYKRGPTTLAVVTVGRDLESLKAEVAFEAQS